jgi:predicted nucleotidyltransferase
MDREQILATLRQHRSTLSERFGVESIALFGSQARGDATATSDIDLLVALRPEHRTLRNYFQLREYLERELGGRVDLGTVDAIKPAIRARISAEAIYA